MPDIMTWDGLALMLVIGLLLLMLIWFRAKRTGGKVMPGYALLWTCICVGWTVLSFAERSHLGQSMIVSVILAIVVPNAAAMIVQRLFLPNTAPEPRRIV